MALPPKPKSRPTRRYRWMLTALSATGLGCSSGAMRIGAVRIGPPPEPERYCPAFVDGSVSFQNEPVANATITLIPEAGGATSVGTDEDGRYRLTVPCGNSKLEVRVDGELRLERPVFVDGYGDPNDEPFFIVLEVPAKAVDTPAVATDAGPAEGDGDAG